MTVIMFKMKGPVWNASRRSWGHIPFYIFVLLSDALLDVKSVVGFVSTQMTREPVFPLT